MDSKTSRNTGCPGSYGLSLTLGAMLSTTPSKWVPGMPSGVIWTCSAKQTLETSRSLTKARTRCLRSSTMVIKVTGAIELTSCPELTRVLNITPLIGASTVQ
jgi:hypothetical protein